MPETTPTLADPEAAVARLQEVSPELRGCAILDAAGSVLACRGDAGEEGWQAAAAALIAAADRAGEGPAAHVHVATTEGEVLMVRGSELVAVAATERFVLASLMLFDMRAALRQLARSGRS
jgi:hypothetical protein